MKIILDTCALIWWSLDPDLLSVSAKNLCDEMEQKKNGLVASMRWVVHDFNVFSMRRSGMSQMTATKIYNPQPSQGLTVT